MEPLEAELADLCAVPTSSAAVARALALHRDGALRTPRAKALAATLLLAADEPATVQVAQDLALAAMASHRPARRLAAEAFDRLRVLQGQPQKFGTQRRADGSPWPIDPATTDSERAKWDVPPRSRLLDPAPNGG